VSDPILLHIVTDDADRACLGLFGFARKQAPGWVGFVNDPAGFRKIPEGAAVMSVWFSERSLIETLWREERAVRAFDIDYGKHAARIEDWLNRRAEAERALIAQWLAEDAGADAAKQAEPVPSAAAAPIPMPAELPKVMWS
jgi:hypothetical protein